MSAIIWAAAALAITGTIAFASLRAWRGWLDLKRFEIAARQESERETSDLAPGIRIYMANLKERPRKPQAIPQGVVL